MTLSVYTRNQDGTLNHSTRIWSGSVDSFWKALRVWGFPEENEVLAGWPDANVKWRGNVGIGY